LNAGKIKLQKSDLPTEVEKTNPSKAMTTLSNVTKAICSVSGQVQLAEISKKIDIIDDKWKVKKSSCFGEQTVDRRKKSAQRLRLSLTITK